MAKNRVKGITIQIGGDTTQLDKALTGVNKEIRTTQSSLRDVEKLLKLDPTNTELLAQKQRLLGQQIDQTKDKLNTLRDAEKQVQQQFKQGKVSQEVYDALQREIASTEISLKQAEKAADDLNNVLEKADGGGLKELSRSADNAEQSLKDVADAADDVKDNVQGADFGDVLGASAIVEGAGQIIDALGEVREEVREYQRIMASLDVSSQNAGYTAEETADSYNKLYGVLGDEQTAATTLSNLQALRLAQGDLTTLIDETIGAWATYGDSIPIDSLAEAINETIRTGTVTGTFADVLNWGSEQGETFGVAMKEATEANEEWNQSVQDAQSAEDYFNLALQECNDQTERQNLVMQALADQGLAQAGQAWQNQNQDLIEANQAQAEFMENASRLTEELVPVFTALQDGFNSLFEALINLMDGVDFEAIGNLISGAFQFLIDNGELIISILAGVGAGLAAMNLAKVANDMVNVATNVATLADTFPLLNNAIGLLTNPIFLVTSAVVALVALIATKGDEIQAILQKVDNFLQNVFATDWTTVLGPVLGGALNSFFANLKNIWDSVYQILNGVIDFVRGVFTGDWQRVWQGVQAIFGGILNGLVAIAKAPINGIIGLINGLLGSINWVIRKVNSLSFTNPFTGESVGFNFSEFGTIPYLAKGGVLTRGSAIVGEAGPELLTLHNGRAIVQPLTNNTTNNTANLGGVSINVYGAPGQDVQELADIVMDEIQATYARKAAVYGA